MSELDYAEENRDYVDDEDRRIRCSNCGAGVQAEDEPVGLCAECRRQQNEEFDGEV